MYVVELSPLSELQILEALVFTLEKFGPKQQARYEVLIEQAIDTLRDKPHEGRERPEIAPGAWTLHIKRRGRRARHLFLYRIHEGSRLVQVVAFIHDGSDIPSHWEV